MKTPTALADKLGETAVERLSAQERKTDGVFFTPEPIARFMASHLDITGEDVRILDPAAGSGVLACAAIEYLVEQDTPPNTIQVVAYEIRPDMYEHLCSALNFAAEWAADKGIVVEVTAHCKDYISDYAMHPVLGINDGIFDLVIANPPYFKLSAQDPRWLALKQAIPNQPNIYSMFMTLAARQLVEGGQLIFIVPRSFSSGIYFKPFRKWFLSIVQLTHLHMFGSRRQAFKRDAVLQENVILAGQRVEKADVTQEVILTHSDGVGDLDNPERWVAPLSDLYEYRSQDLLLRMPSSAEDMQIMRLIDDLPNTLSSLGLSVSTGPVVAFRAWDVIADEPNESVIPLLWLHHIQPGFIQWPVENRSNQYMSEPTPKLVVDKQNMVILRRFSAKDEPRRLTAAAFLKEDYDFSHVGIENHLNYIYQKNGALSEVEAIGLSAILNSPLMDRYFRCVSGNTQVGAAELRHLPLPSREVIQQIGLVARENQIAQEVIETLILGKELLLAGD